MSQGAIQPGPQGSAAAQPVSPSVLTPSFVIQTYENAEWEQFVLEYLGAAVPSYALIEPKGGAGDKGRDLVAFLVRPPDVGAIDIYQCKAYKDKLAPADIWIELGKLCVFTFKGDYPVPRKYAFVAPRGVGTTLGDLLKNSDQIREDLIANWDHHCKDKISKIESFPLTGKLKAYVDAFDFTIVGYVPVHELLEQHHRTAHWHRRFKRDYPPRPRPAAPPSGIQAHELRYVEQLLDAYSDHLGRPIRDIAALAGEAKVITEHLLRSRTDFFMADSLNRFYRDQFPEGAFDHVKAQVHDGVVETANSPHPDGLARVRATVQQAAQLPLAETEYTPYVEPGDKKGLCHHLANDDKIRWVQK